MYNIQKTLKTRYNLEECVLKKVNENFRLTVKGCKTTAILESIFQECCNELKLIYKKNFKRFSIGCCGQHPKLKEENIENVTRIEDYIPQETI